MNAISSAIVIMCATTLLIAGSYHHHGDSGLFLQFVGCLLGTVGVFAWLTSVGVIRHWLGEPVPTTKTSIDSARIYPEQA